MLSVAEARARVLRGLAPTGPEIVSLAEAPGRVAASDLEARLSQPAHDVSAMDGYAVRASDAREGATLALAAAAPAGHPTARPVGPGETIRIFTGSVLPAGADAVLIQENATRLEDGIRVEVAPTPGRHIRRRGGDFAEGDVVIRAGTRLGARAVGLAASAGHPWIAVRRRPRVALLATGDEIVLPGEPIPPGGLPSSNSFALAALIKGQGGEPLILPVARDDIAAIADAAAGCRHADLLVTLGGASVGDHDLVRPALARHGFAPDVWKIAMRPGKPLMHGALRFGAHEVPVLGLPGNPVSALVCAALFLAPAIASLLGLPEQTPRRRRARLATGLPENDGRADFLRGAVEEDAAGELVATPFESQDSARLAALSRADALILRAPHAPPAAAGDEVELLLLSDLGL